MTHPHADGPRVNTVLGPVPADQLGVVAVHEALLSVLPGAQHAPDISMDRAEILGAILAKLNGFRAAGGGAVVDATGMCVPIMCTDGFAIHEYQVTDVQACSRGRMSRCC